MQELREKWIEKMEMKRQEDVTNPEDKINDEDYFKDHYIKMKQEQDYRNIPKDKIEKQLAELNLQYKPKKNEWLLISVLFH